MLATIQSAITFLETQLEGIDQRRARVVAALDGLRMFGEASPSVVRPFRAKANGTHALILDVVRDGADKISLIAKAAKVKESTARAAVLQLEQAGRVKREGKGSLTRYRAA